MLVVALAGFKVWENADSRRKLDSMELVRVVANGAEVILRFPPETFHMTALQGVGRVVGIKGNSAFIMDVKPEAMRALAGAYWVREVLPIVQ